MRLPKNYKDIFILFLVGTSGGQEKVKSQGLMRDDFMDLNPVGSSTSSWSIKKAGGCRLPL